MRRAFLPFSPPCLDGDEIEEVAEALRSEWITTGPRTGRFEEEFARRVGSTSAVALSSGTAALHVALATLGVGAGDIVATTTMTFCSTVHVIEHVGAIPLLFDVETDTLNIDPVQLAQAIRSERRLKAVIPVHYGGHPCEMDSILELAASREILVIEDAAHALPAMYRERPVGEVRGESQAVCFSFYATKNLTTGEGGMMTGAPKVIEEARRWSLHGMSRDAWRRHGPGASWHYEVDRPGFKYNMTDVQAALGLCQLKKLAQFHRRRQEIARRYVAAFSDMEEIELPVARPHVMSAWHLFPVRLRLDALAISRDRFIREMTGRQIGVSVHFIPVHMHRYYREKYAYQPSDFPVALAAYERLVSLPIHPGMSDEDVHRVCAAVADIVAHYRR